MRRKKHPLSGAIYEVGDDGMVHVNKAGVLGVFRPDGQWVSGTLKTADMHLCGWIAGPQLPPGKSIPQRDLPTAPMPEFVTD